MKGRGNEIHPRWGRWEVGRGCCRSNQIFLRRKLVKTLSLMSSDGPACVRGLSHHFRGSFGQNRQKMNEINSSKWRKPVKLLYLFSMRLN